MLDIKVLNNIKHLSYAEYKALDDWNNTGNIERKKKKWNICMNRAKRVILLKSCTHTILPIHFSFYFVLYMLDCRKPKECNFLCEKIFLVLHALGFE